ncbi:MAG: phosphoribosyl-AMP cyclohydrolase [Terriglobales bacterium]
MELDFDKMEGLVPAIIQDAGNRELLMVGFMNKEALTATLRTGFVTFYSRTRQKLWTKGETSGNRLQVAAAWTDCDRDTVLLLVRVLGEGQVCHNGTRSCFTEQLQLETAAVGAVPYRSDKFEREKFEAAKPDPMKAAR